jgi:hypothetical protein
MYIARPTYNGSSAFGGLDSHRYSLRGSGFDHDNYGCSSGIYTPTDYRRDVPSYNMPQSYNQLRRHG